MSKKIIKYLIFTLICLFLTGFTVIGCQPAMQQVERVISEQQDAQQQVTDQQQQTEQQTAEPQEQSATQEAQAEPEPQTEMAGYELTSQDRIILTQPSVCSVITVYYGYVYDAWYNDWSDLYYYGPVYGTGFCVNPDSGHIITAAHVINVPEDEVKYAIIEAFIYDYYDVSTFSDADWNEAFATFKVEGENSATPDEEVWVQFNTATGGVPDGADSSYMRAEIIDFSPAEQRDMAVLKVQPTSGRSLSSVMVGDSSMVEISDAVTVIGYPWTGDISMESIMTPTNTSGVVSARKMIGGAEVLQIDGNVTFGNSGGPVLSDNGEVIGIVSFGTSELTSFLVTSNDIKELMRQNGVENKLGMVDEEFKQGIINYRMENYQESINHFNAVLNLSQGHLWAQDYRAKAQSAMSGG